MKELAAHVAQDEETLQRHREDLGLIVECLSVFPYAEEQHLFQKTHKLNQDCHYLIVVCLLA